MQKMKNGKNSLNINDSEMVKSYEQSDSHLWYKFIKKGLYKVIQDLDSLLRHDINDNEVNLLFAECSWKK